MFFAILLAEDLFATRCKPLVSLTVAASDYPRRVAPYFHFAITDQLSLCPAFRVR